MQMQYRWWMLGLVLALGSVPVGGQAQEKVGSLIELAEGKMVLKAPADWTAVPRKNNVISHEFVAPASAEKDKQARVTVSLAGGGVGPNLDRWYTQFEQPDGSKTADKAKVEKIDVAGQTIHIIQVPGTFLDKGGAGPFQQAPAVKREKYELLGAIIETKDMGLHFFKITGPAESVEPLKKGFRQMLENLEVKK